MIWANRRRQRLEARFWALVALNFCAISANVYMLLSRLISQPLCSRICEVLMINASELTCLIGWGSITLLAGIAIAVSGYFYTMSQYPAWFRCLK